jgi:hypothetical protein
MEIFGLEINITPVMVILWLIGAIAIFFTLKQMDTNLFYHVAAQVVYIPIIFTLLNMIGNKEE